MKHPRKDAVTKAMDYLAIRDHSAYELEKKLTQKEYTPEEIEKALSHVQERGWLLPPDELSERVAEQLHRKNKGYSYILQYLKEKRLPAVDKDYERELEKAQELLSKRFPGLSNPSFTDKKQVARMLKNRGFDHETISSFCRQL